VRFRVGARTDVGRVRQGNEDSYMVHEPLFAVADGMGGHQGGEVASNLALEALGRVAGEPAPDGDTAPRLAEVVRDANRAVLQRASGDPALSGMGTTLTAVLAGTGTRIHIAHVGDSRAYLLRDGELSQLTRDQTVVQRLVDEGRITAEEAEIHPQRSILTNALGVDQDIEVDEASYELRIGDRLLLCSDGLSGMVPEEQIKRILQEHEDPQAACDALVEAANQAGGQDNITSVVLDAVDDAEAPAAPLVAGAGAPTLGGARTAPSSADAPTRPSATPPGPPSGQPAAAATSPPQAPQPPPGQAVTPPATPVAEPTPEAAFAAGQHRPGRVRRLVLWLLIPLLLLVGAFFVVKRLFVDNQWFVGVSEDGNVALFQGVPAAPLGFELYSLQEESDLRASEVSALRPEWADLEEGITEDSEEAARSIISAMTDAVEREQQEQQEQDQPEEPDGAGGGGGGGGGGS
jgi:PPM family protein phosphatase